MSGKTKEAKEKPDSVALIERLRTNRHAIKITSQQKQEKQQKGLLPVLLLSTLNKPW